MKVNIRSATNEDWATLPRYSYSALDIFNQCRYRFYLKYVLGNYPKQHAIALELGTFLHSIMEQKGNAIIEKSNVFTEKEAKAEYEDKYETLKGEFFEDFATPDKDGRYYTDKIDTFWNNYEQEMTSSDWKPYACEKEFKLVYDEKCVIRGFIDRVDINSNGDLRVIDYKTNRQPFSPKQRAESLQMWTYAMAVYVLYGKWPVEFQYDFLFFDFDDRRMLPALYKEDSIDIVSKKFDELINNIDECKRNGNWYPSNNTPLCHWCDYCTTNDNADRTMKNLCDYYCIWTPNNKTFSVNKKVDRESFNVNDVKVKKTNEIIW